jgi:electron transport complex protein RnfC
VLGILKLRTFTGGIHPPESKRTKNCAIEKIEPPPQVIIPVQQHLGAPAEPIVEKGSTVKIGDPLGKHHGFVSVPIHASVSGTVKAVEERPHPLGPDILSVVIDNDFKETMNSEIGFDEDYLKLKVKEMIDRILNAGIAGLGGATFPSHVKLSPPADKPIDTLIINGVECEPFLTSDHRLMVEQPKTILLGVQLIAKILDVKKIAIGIEKNKPDAIKIMNRLTAELDLPYQVYPLHVKYPQGAEKQLINAITGKSVPSGGLPMDVGCVVHNVGTAAAIYEAIAYKKPLIERVITVTGKGIKEGKNLRVKIGTPFSHVFKACGELTDDAGKIVMGGPMMGLAQSSVDVPVIKGTSGILILDKKQSKRQEENVCISCARCVDACPMGLLPKILGNYAKHYRFDDMENYNVLDCIECGSCAFVCPSHINLVHLIRFGKSEVMKNKKQAS